MKKYAFAVILSLFTLSNLSAVPRVHNPKKRATIVGICGAAIVGLTAWAWWNNYIQFPGEADFVARATIGDNFQSEMSVQQTAAFPLNKFEVNGGSFGSGIITQEAFTWGATLNLKSSDGTLLATGRKEVFTFVSTIQVNDENGNRIGTLKKDWTSSLGSIVSVYSILDANDNIIATSDRIKAPLKEFTLKTPDNQVLVLIDRALNSFSDVFLHSWSVKVIQAGAIDDRLIALLPAFDTTTSK